MNTPPANRLEAALAAFAERYEALARVREQIRALSVTACSRDGVVEVTVDSDGRAANVRFVDRRFREMTPSQLADSVREALATARTEVVARATAVVSAANLRLLPAAHRPCTEQSTAGFDEVPSSCWRRLVREARSLTTAGPIPAREPDTLRAWGDTVRREAGTAVLMAAPQRPQGPLWGRRRPSPRSGPSQDLLPAELREAVLALRNSVCDAVRPSGMPEACRCTAQMPRPLRGAEAAAEPA
ncbi:YbaB/EbfC family nucleoid-associated protein [Streptomyces sp. NPDC093516]|uniref:YbaB/EbfC family nucleoid-associated protein n=1 Tax=Streptomyces sp. NPDC093516 TaxID=3155304 RepID=UPI0034206F00